MPKIKSQKIHPQRGELECSLLKNRTTIVGVDEVGRGCIAGPVFAGCALLDYSKLHELPKNDLDLIRDSKTLSSKQRETAVGLIESIAIQASLGIASVEEVDLFGIVPACFLAMQRALDQLKSTPDIVLVDGAMPIPNLGISQQTVIRGDSLCFVIAAAAIIAKVARDQWMQEQSEQFSGYGFEQHVGYGTAKHIQALQRLGPCPLHRKTFEPIRTMLAGTPFVPTKNLAPRPSPLSANT